MNKLQYTKWAGEVAKQKYSMKDIKKLFFNVDDLKSYNKTELEKFNLENKRYNLLETKQISFNEFILFYGKEV